MNLASKITAVHVNRDNEIANYIIRTIDECLENAAWLLNSDNYSRSDENEIRYTFNLCDIMRSYIQVEEQQWPSCKVRNIIYDYYLSAGFNVGISSSDELTLKLIAVVEADELGNA